jgi:hypothetical protein
MMFHDTRATLTDEDWSAVFANSWQLEPQLDYLRDRLTAIGEACAPERMVVTLRCLSNAAYSTSPR